MYVITFFINHFTHIQIPSWHNERFETFVIQILKLSLQTNFIIYVPHHQLLFNFIIMNILVLISTFTR